MVVRHKVSFSSRQAIAVVNGLTYRMLDYWARESILVPSIMDAHGSGSSRRYSFMDLVAARALVVLRAGGMDLRVLPNVATSIQAFGLTDESLGEVRLIVANDEVAVIRNDGRYRERVDSVRQGAVHWTMIDLSLIVRELQESIQDLKPAKV
jgi:DNA-binding transcriptional MerR regulator